MNLYAASPGCSMCCSSGYCQGAFRGQPGLCCPNMRNCCPNGFHCNFAGRCYPGGSSPLVPAPNPYFPAPSPYGYPPSPPQYAPQPNPYVPPTLPTPMPTRPTPMPTQPPVFTGPKEPVSPCIHDTGGTCRIFGCSSSRGEASCEDGKCMCKPGYCSIGNLCKHMLKRDTRDL